MLLILLQKFGISLENTMSRKRAIEHILREVQNNNVNLRKLLRKGRKDLYALNIYTGRQYEPGYSKVRR